MSEWTLETNEFDLDIRITETEDTGDEKTPQLDCTGWGTTCSPTCDGINGTCSTCATCNHPC